MDKAQAAYRLINVADPNGHFVSFVAEYGEPGYATDGIVVFGNWNDKQHYDAAGRRVTTDNMPSRMDAALTRLDIGVDWSDEWAVCEGCERAYRTQPDSYYWKPSIRLTDDGYVCASCLKSDPDRLRDLLIDDYLNQPQRMVTFLDADEICAVLPEFVPYGQTFTSGWHVGQTDTGETVAARLPPGTNYILVQGEQSQFYITFTVLLHQPEEDSE